MYCKKCGKYLKNDYKYCIYCGKPIYEKVTQNVGENLNIYDIVSFVGKNTEYYAYEFQKMKTKNTKISINWCSFLLGAYWFIYRKMYNYGINIIIANSIIYLFGCIIDYRFLSLMWLIIFIENVAFGVVGNYIYMNWLGKKTSEIKSSSSELYKSQMTHKISDVSNKITIIVTILILTLSYYLWSFCMYCYQSANAVSKMSEEYSEPSENYSSQINASGGMAYTGKWEDANGGAHCCFLKISSDDGINYDIMLRWDNSASESTKWYFKGTYNNSIGKLEYSDGEEIFYYTNPQGTTSSRVVYSSLSGYFLRYNDNEMYWHDYTEDLSDGCKFFKESNY